LSFGRGCGYQGSGQRKQERVKEGRGWKRKLYIHFLLLPPRNALLRKVQQQTCPKTHPQDSFPEFSSSLHPYEPGILFLLPPCITYWRHCLGPYLPPPYILLFPHLLVTRGPRPVTPDHTFSRPCPCLPPSLLSFVPPSKIRLLLFCLTLATSFLPSLGSGRQNGFSIYLSCIYPSHDVLNVSLFTNPAFIRLMTV
jgi:hypothetical protein